MIGCSNTYKLPYLSIEEGFLDGFVHLNGGMISLWRECLEGSIKNIIQVFTSSSIFFMEKFCFNGIYCLLCNEYTKRCTSFRIFIFLL